MMGKALLVLAVAGFVGAASGAAHGREREGDGAFSPRDASHNKDGKHDSQFDREAILGSHKEAEEFEDLPPAVAKERLLQLAKKMDRNGDGYVDKTELKQWVLRSFRALSREDSDERLEEVDMNKDRVVTWDEYKKAEFSDVDAEVGGADVDASSLDELAMMEEDKILFEAADFNGDGSLSADEFFSFAHPEDDLERMRTAVATLTKKTKDTNKDGVIDFTEFVGDKARDHNKEWLKQEKERFDNEIDKDGDGTLGDAEIVAWIVPDNEDIAKDEVDHLFAGSDDDHDSRLSMKEIEDHSDVFVGSEVTDYGQHLHKMGRFEDEL